MFVHAELAAPHPEIRTDGEPGARLAWPSVRCFDPCAPVCHAYLPVQDLGEPRWHAARSTSSSLLGPPLWCRTKPNARFAVSEAPQRALSHHEHSGPHERLFTSTPKFRPAPGINSRGHQFALRFAFSRNQSSRTSFFAQRAHVAPGMRKNHGTSQGHPRSSSAARTLVAQDLAQGLPKELPPVEQRRRLV